MGQIVLLSSAVRNSTNNSGNQNRTWNERGAQFILNVTSAPGVDTITLSIQGMDALGNYYTLLTGAAVVAIGLNVYEVHPNANETANVKAKTFLPDTWRAVVTHSAGSNFTYTLCANTMD